ncbi:MAG: type I-B CRISPR-associated protein Cas8b1/Cst1 [Deltaproteobacteria bacterium]|nr:type I-B CRISPR-associated protein Cas8b1/Cst1 [Deltaproteobacteria bacterium]
MLKYTGHPFVDVGVATITAFAGKHDPTHLTDADIKMVVDYITREYVRQPLKSFLTVAFPNSGFTNPAFDKKPESKLEYARRVLRSVDAPKSNELCVFTGDPAVNVVFKEKEDIPPGHAFRQHIPLLTGENVINFFPYGNSGLPVSGKSLLAIQALPLGCAKCGGRLLAVHSDNNELVYHFASNFLSENRKAVQIAQISGSKKMPETQLLHRTLLIATLLQRDMREDKQPFSLTAYRFSNSGQGVGLDIYSLPLEIIGFLQEMNTADYSNEWNGIVSRAWEVESTKKRVKKDDTHFQPRRNWLYEDLFDLPINAPIFLRTYFLRHALRYARADLGDPRGDYSLLNEANLVSWKITACFLRRIMHMDRERIEQIRTMGDKLAEYVSKQNDRRFFRDFYTEQRYDFLRTTLIKANLAHVKAGNPPIITLDSYIAVFEEGEELARSEWRLARDLVLIRVVERLHEQGWLGRNVDVIQESAEGESETA